MSVSSTAALSLFLLMAGLAMATMDDPFESFPLGLRLESLQKRRGRELFGKRSGPMERQSRRTRELFGKRAASDLSDESTQLQQQWDEPTAIAELVEFVDARKRAFPGDEQQDSVGIERLLSLLGHYQRARRARGVQRELFGR